MLDLAEKSLTAKSMSAKSSFHCLIYQSILTVSFAISVRYSFKFLDSPAGNTKFPSLSVFLLSSDVLRVVSVVEAVEEPHVLLIVLQFVVLF